MELATAFVTIRPQTDGFESELASAIGSQPDVEIPVAADVTADVSAAEAEIDGLEAAPVEVPVTADTGQAQEQISGLGESINGLLDGGGGGDPGQLGSFAEAAGIAGASSMTAATGGIAALGLGLGYAASEAMEAETVVAQLDQMVQNAGSNAGVTSGGLKSMASQIQRTAGFSDEAVMSGEAMVLMFENVRNTADQPIFDRTIKASADLARSPAFNGDIAGAARTLGRAIDDPTAGMGRLRRAGIQLTEAQEENIKSLQEAGRLEEAQAALLEVVEGKVQGLADAYGGTLAGSLDKTKEKLGEMAETIGGVVIPVVGSFVGVLADATDAAYNLGFALGEGWQGRGMQGPVQFIEGVGTVVGGLPPSLLAAAAAADDLTVSADQAGYAVSNLGDRVQGYLDGVFSVPEAERALRDSFATLATVLTDPARAADDVAVSLQTVVERTAAVGSATGDMTGAVDAAVFGLAGLQAQGKLSAAEVAEVTSQLESIPGNTEGNVSTPGAPAARSQAQAVADALLGIPPYTRAVVVVDAVTSGIDAAGRAIAGLRADAARGITVTTQGVKDSAQLAIETGAGIGRPAVSSVAPAALPPVQVVVDGQVVAEASFEHNRRLAMAEGYEQP